MRAVFLQWPRKRRSAGLKWLTAAVVVFGVLVLGPVLQDAWRFRAGALVGLTPAEVEARLGEPLFARPLSDGSPGWTLPPEFERPVWRELPGPARGRLVASPRFVFNYAGPMGAGHTVTFERGVVTAVESWGR